MRRGRARGGQLVRARRAGGVSGVERLFGARAADADPPELAALARELPDGVEAALAFARPLLEAYARAPATPESARAWGALGHYRLAALAGALAVQADPAAAEFDLLAGAALRHTADSAAQAGRWLAEAFDLRLPPRVRPDPAGRDLIGRLSFLDPALGGALRDRRLWLADIQGIGRRAAQEPVTFRGGGGDCLPGARGRAPAAQALPEHLAELRGFLQAVSSAVERIRAAGGRPREEPDAAWLDD